MLTCIVFGWNKDASWAVWALLFICTVRVFILICAEIHRYTGCIRKTEAPKYRCISRKSSLMVSVLGFFIRLLITDSLYISINRKSHVKLNSARISIERSRLKHFNDKTIFLFLKRISKHKVEGLRPFQVPFTVCIRSLGSLQAFDCQHSQTFTVPPKNAYRKSALLKRFAPLPFYRCGVPDHESCTVKALQTDNLF